MYVCMYVCMYSAMDKLLFKSCRNEKNTDILDLFTKITRYFYILKYNHGLKTTSESPTSLSNSQLV